MHDKLIVEWRAKGEELYTHTDPCDKSEADGLFYCADALESALAQMGRETCNRPPEGWHCGLDRDHEGPCPAWPVSHATSHRFLRKRTLAESLKVNWMEPSGMKLLPLEPDEAMIDAGHTAFNGCDRSDYRECVGIYKDMIAAYKGEP